MKIGNIELKHGLLLSPMAGVTDAAFRKIAKQHGAEYLVTEMVSAKALCYEQLCKKNPTDQKIRTAPLCQVTEEEYPIAVQLFGHEPEYFAEAAKRLEMGEYRGHTGVIPSAIDINMGCPMPKIVNNGDGSALMKNPKLAGEIVRATVNATTLPVTVKFRLGWSEDEKNYEEFALAIADAGASAICLHARTKTQLYSGKADWNAIKSIKRISPIPVFGNGDIVTGADAKRMLEETGCDGVAVGRGAMGNPWLFEEIACALEKKDYTPPTKKEKIQTAILHTEALISFKGEKTGFSEAKKHLAWYLTGMHGATALRRELMVCTEFEKAKKLLLDFASQP